jgi:anti-repressor protein
MTDELVKVINGKTVVSSRDVAENFGKRHDKLTYEIERMYGGLPEMVDTPMFQKTTYVNQQNGQEYPEYLMNRDGFSLLVMGFTGAKALEWKLKYIAAFNSMEQRLTFAIPQTYAEALQLAADQAKELLLAKPKVDFYDTVANSDSLLSMADVAKVLDKGIGRNRLFKLLRSRGILQGNNVPYQRFVDAGYFKVVESSYMAGDNAIVSTVTYVKQKGVDYIRKLLEENK